MPNIGAPELLIIIIIEAVFVGLVAWLAAKKGYSAVVWGILGFFFSWIALIIVLVLPDHRQAPPADGAAGG